MVCGIYRFTFILCYVTLQLLLPLVTEQDQSWFILGNIYFQSPLVSCALMENETEANTYFIFVIWKSKKREERRR